MYNVVKKNIENLFLVNKKQKEFELEDTLNNIQFQMDKAKMDYQLNLFSTKKFS